MPDTDRLVLKVSEMIKNGFLQQNAFHKEDTYVPLEKQYNMMTLILHLNDKMRELVDRNIPVSLMHESGIIDEIIRMKYTIPNDDLSQFVILRTKIDDAFNKIIDKYNG